MSLRLALTLLIAFTLAAVAGYGSLADEGEVRADAPPRRPPQEAPVLLAPAIVELEVAAVLEAADLPEPAGIETPDGALHISVDALGRASIGGNRRSDDGLLASLAAHASRHRDGEGISMEAMVVYAHRETPWRSVRRALSLCSHPDVRIERVMLGTRGGRALPIHVPRDRLPPRGVRNRIEEEPRIIVELRGQDGTTVQLLDLVLGTGEGAFTQCAEYVRRISPENPELFGEIVAGPSVPVTDVARTLGIFHAAGIGTLVDRVPAVAWEMEEFFRRIESLPEDRVVPGLIDALDSKDWRIEWEAAIRLAEIGAPAVPSLLGALRSETWDVAEGACRALTWIGDKTGMEEAVPALLDLIERGDPFSNEEHARDLIVTIGAPAAARLVRMRGNDLADLVLSRMDRHAVPGIVPALADPDETIRLRAVCALRDLRGKSELAVPAVIPLLDDANHTIRYVAVEVVARFHRERGARSALLRALGDRDPYVRALAAKSFPRDSDEFRRGFGVLLADLRAGEVAAAHAFRDLGCAAEPAVPDLLDALSSGDPDLRGAAALALGTTRSRAPEVKAALTRIADDESEEVRVRIRARKALAR